MKIAVTYENGQVFGHFGHCRQFLVAEVENGQVIRSEVVPVLAAVTAHWLDSCTVWALKSSSAAASAPAPAPLWLRLESSSIPVYPATLWRQYSSWLPETWPLTRTPPAIITMRKAIPAASMTAVSTPAAGITRANAGKRIRCREVLSRARRWLWRAVSRQVLIRR